MTRQTTDPLRRMPINGPLDIYRYEVETGNMVSTDTRQTLRPLSPWTQADFRRAKIGMVYILVDPRDRQVRYVGYTLKLLTRTA